MINGQVWTDPAELFCKVDFAFVHRDDLSDQSTLFTLTSVIIEIKSI